MSTNQNNNREEEKEHVPQARLFLVAVADNLQFTDEEADHLLQCSTCRAEWKHHVETIRHALVVPSFFEQLMH